jgi:glycosyltransferase involved in cell wall biosynthesis
MVIVEAFSRGLAVVSTPVGAIPEVVEDGRNGLLTAAGDVDALANALSRLIDDPDLRSRLGRTAQSDHAAHFSFDAYVERLAELWRAAAPRG